MWFLSSRKNRRSNSAPARRPRVRPCLEMLEDRCVPSAGQLDPTFGSGGIVSTPVKTSSFAQAVLIQPDGKVVSVGEWSGGMAVVRYTSSGGLDSTFGSGGEVALSNSAKGFAGALQSDGKIVVVGDARIKPNEDETEIVMVRLNANGTLDTTFGKGGTVKETFAGAAHAVVIQPNGKIDVAGWTYGSYDWALARFNINGSLDSTFGSGGEVTGSFNAQLYAMALQPDGKLDVFGTTFVGGRAYFGLGRYNSNGTLDTSFGNGGVVETAFNPGDSTANDTGTAMALQSDGKIVVAGGGQGTDPVTNNGYNQWELARYNPDGSLDTSFAGTGLVTLKRQSYGSQINAVAIQPWNGQIVAEGRYVSSTHFPGTQVARINSDGSQDTTYAGTGTNLPNFSSGLGGGLAIYPVAGTVNDGKSVIVGGGFSGARILPSQPEITSFTAGTNPVTSGSSETLTASSITDGNAGATIAQVAFYLDSNNDGILEPGTDTLLGYGTQTSPGVWSYTFTVTQATGNYTLFAQAKDSYGVFGDPVALSLTVS